MTSDFRVGRSKMTPKNRMLLRRQVKNHRKLSDVINGRSLDILGQKHFSQNNQIQRRVILY